MKSEQQMRVSYLEGKIEECESAIECLLYKHEPDECEQEIDELESELEGYREEYGRLRTAADDELMEMSRHW